MKHTLQSVNERLDNFKENVYHESYLAAKSFLNSNAFLRFPLITYSDDKHVVFEFNDGKYFLGDIEFEFDGSEVRMTCYTRGLDITTGFASDFNIMQYCKTRFGVSPIK